MSVAKSPSENPPRTPGGAGASQAASSPARVLFKYATLAASAARRAPALASRARGVSGWTLRGLAAAGAAALILGIVTHESGSAAQASAHERAGSEHVHGRVAILDRPETRFERSIRFARRTAGRADAVPSDMASGESGTPQTDGGFPSPESVGVSNATLDAIAACESGGDPTAVSVDGTYRGLYQFDYRTWASVGGSGDPAAASPEEQTYRAALLYARSGSSPWPICGS